MAAFMGSFRMSNPCFRGKSPGYWYLSRDIWRWVPHCRKLLRLFLVNSILSFLRHSPASHRQQRYKALLEAFLSNQSNVTSRICARLRATFCNADNARSWCESPEVRIHWIGGTHDHGTCYPLINRDLAVHSSSNCLDNVSAAGKAWIFTQGRLRWMHCQSEEKCAILFAMRSQQSRRAVLAGQTKSRAQNASYQGINLRRIFCALLPMG